MLSLLRSLRALSLALLPFLAALTCVLLPNGGLQITTPPLGEFFPLIEQVLPYVVEWSPYLLMAYEGLVRAVPSVRDYSLTNLLGKLFDYLFPNRSINGFEHKVKIEYAA